MTRESTALPGTLSAAMLTPRRVWEAAWLLLGLAVPVAFQRWSYDAFELPKQVVNLVVVEAAAVLALALWLVRTPKNDWRTRIRGLPSWLRARAGVCVALGVGAAWLLAAAGSVAPEQSWWGLPPRWAGARAQLAHAVLLAAASCCLRRPEQLQRLAVVTAAAGSLAAGYGLLQRFGRDPFEWGGYVGATVAADLTGRPPGTFGNPNFLAGYLVLSTYVTAGALVTARRPIVRGALAAAALIQVAALAFTQTRGAWLGAMAGAAAFATLLAALRGRAWRRWLAGAVGVAVTVLLGLRIAQPVLTEGTLLARAANMVSPTEVTASIRLALWRLTSTAWLARPLTGFGPDAIAPVFQRAYGADLVAAEGPKGGGTQYDRSENATIDTLLATGALGGLSLLAVGVVTAWSVARLARRARAAPGPWLPLMAGTAAALAAHLVAQQFNVEVVGASFLAWLLAGALIGLGQDPAAPGAAGATEADAGVPGRSAAVVAALAAGAMAATAIAWWEVRPLRAGVEYEQGLTLQRAGRPAEAIPRLNAANGLWPHYYLYWAELGYADRAAARTASGPEKERLYRDALRAVDRGIQLNAAHPLVWSYWGDIAAEVALATNDLTLRNRAKAAHVRATDLAPGWWRYWQSAGESDMLLGDFPAAKERFTRSAALSPGNWVLWASLGDAANRQGDIAVARMAYERALGLNPGEATVTTIRRALESLAG
ncbi:MAG TPA: tetratricopeptide repeat protein [Chloroflexota bacterium]|nr:tetratricopeptide repeat protein [Chloroflexota bacterium]